MSKAQPNSGFSIRMASSMSGHSAHTLRAWERRYGFPVPLRTAGGARRYQQAQIDSLKLVGRALALGFRAGEVVGRADPEIRQLIAGSNGKSATTDNAEANGKDASITLDALVHRLLSDDSEGMRRGLEYAAANLGPVRFVTECVQPLLQQIGDRWAAGEVSIQQEHLASEILTTQLRILLHAYDDLRGAPLMLLTAPSGEWHALGMQMVGLFCALHGATPRLLGVNTPVEAALEAVRRREAQVLAVSLSAAAAPDHCRDYVRALRKGLPSDVELWIGGEGARAVRLSKGIERLLSWDALREATERWQTR